MSPRAPRTRLLFLIVWDDWSARMRVVIEPVPDDVARAFVRRGLGHYTKEEAVEAVRRATEEMADLSKQFPQTGPHIFKVPSLAQLRRRVTLPPEEGLYDSPTPPPDLQPQAPSQPVQEE